MVILWAYAYQLVVWPLWFNLVVFINAIHGSSLPAPIIVPWEQLMAGTSTLAAVGGIQAWRERDGPTSRSEVTVTSSEVTKT
jgi:hypothetical protein